MLLWLTWGSALCISYSFGGPVRPKSAKYYSFSLVYSSDFAGTHAEQSTNIDRLQLLDFTMSNCSQRQPFSLSLSISCSR